MTEATHVAYTIYVPTGAFQAGDLRDDPNLDALFEYARELFGDEIVALGRLYSFDEED